jgi:hypothetical protein
MWLWLKIGDMTHPKIAFFCKENYDKPMVLEVSHPPACTETIEVPLPKLYPFHMH